MTNNTVQHVGDAATGATAGVGVIHLINENATVISLTVMVVSCVVAIVFHVLNHFLKRRELDLLKSENEDIVISELMSHMRCEQDRAALKMAARAIKGGG